jgi:hypothetical protein
VYSSTETQDPLTGPGCGVWQIEGSCSGQASNVAQHPDPSNIPKLRRRRHVLSICASNAPMLRHEAGLLLW